MSVQKGFVIDGWMVSPSEGLLSRGDETVRLEPKTMEVLVYFASRPNEVITREELERDVWHGALVGYDAVTNTVIKLRKALQDNARQPRCIATIPKKGYQLITPVSTAQGIGNGLATGNTKMTAVTLPKKEKRLIVSFIIIIGFVISFSLILLNLQRNQSRSLPNPAFASSKPSLIVLPFKNLDSDPQQVYFSRGITDDLITALSSYSGIDVISSRVAFQYNDVNLKTLVGELGVRYVIEGSVRRSSRKIRINVQMIDAKRGTNLWARQYNRPLAALFDIQDEVRAGIVSALSLKLSEARTRQEQRHYTNNYHAYDLFLQGQHSLVKRASAADNLQAREYFEQAIAIDPHFVRAYAALAMVNADAYRHDWAKHPKERARIALQQAHYALELDPNSRYACLANGYVEFFVAGNHQQAAAMAERTLKLDPKNADAYLLLATIYVHSGEYKKSEAYVESSMRLNPTPPSIYFHIGALAHLLQGDYPAAVELFKKSLSVNPERLLGKIYMTITMVRMNRLNDAKWYAEEIRVSSPDFNAEQWANKQPFKDRKINRKLRDDLHKAGLK